MFFLFLAYLCLIHRLSKICFGLCKHALIGTLHLPLPNEKCNLPRGRRVLGRVSCAYIGYLRNLLFCNIVVHHRFHVSPQIKDVRQTQCPLPPMSTTNNNTTIMPNIYFSHSHLRMFDFIYLNAFLDVFSDPWHQTSFHLQLADVSPDCLGSAQLL